MNTFFRSLRSFRDSLHHIGTAVNASREYSHADTARAASAKKSNPATAAIPL
ncbi:hypothetical protein M0654_17340 [Rhizobium sp. NTR19]|uniref:Uncharacterized protein n=1 Tax=Neorhizobium turbinariae TaxID=2937795 RepID=A0ABT0IV43_9HYPH|nr:hypothetical protein [Neorhizobium turbinariae]MCK8781748.1 hypothetical protein [Neorhizobium turbinariae]